MRDMEETWIETEHSIQMEQRRYCFLSGIKDVTAFDEHIVQLCTEQGELEIRGNGLHVKQLTLEKGTIEIEGSIDSLEYQNRHTKEGGESFWKRILR